MWRSFSQNDVRFFIARLCAGYQGTLMQLPATYQKITCPTFILWGEHDQHFPPNHAKRLNTLVPGSKLEIIPGAKHWMAWYLASAVAQSIRTFLA
jgi:pimeloyl-ACP methyl ester carboxylesterase